MEYTSAQRWLGHIVIHAIEQRLAKKSSDTGTKQARLRSRLSQFEQQELCDAFTSVFHADRGRAGRSDIEPISLPQYSILSARRRYADGVAGGRVGVIS
jgi:hypothetical protein